MTLLDELVGKIDHLDPKDRAALTAQVAKDAAKRKFTPSPGPQTQAWFCKADVLLYGGEGGGGKRLWDETIVPVPITTDPSGYKRHGDLVVGDEIYSPFGEAIRVSAVTGITEAAPAYELQFNTGETIVADGDHLWHTWTTADRARKLRASPEWRTKRKASRPSRAVENSQKPWVSKSIARINRERDHMVQTADGEVRTTLDIVETLVDKRGAINHSIDTTEGLDGPVADLLVEPYLLGLWLGDGHTRSGEIGMLSDDWAEIEHHCPPVKSEHVDNRPPRIRPFSSRRFQGLHVNLRTIGVLGCKHIPPVYMRASYAQRLALFQGLMDTDGTCAPHGKMELGFSDIRLASDALELAASLGIKATLNAKPTYRKTHYRFCFVAPFPVFRLPRKAQRQTAKCPELTRRRYITGARPVPPVPMRCIKVDAHDGLYLVTRSFITTHNTGLLCGLALEAHTNSLIMRRNGVDLHGGGGVIEDLLRLNGTRDGFNGSAPPTLRTNDGRIITFGSATNIGDEQKYQGRARDFLGIDEATQFAEAQIRFLMGWMRTINEGQRVRVVLATNPPLSSVGEWVIKMFRPWLDTTHPNPARAGELRWYITTGEGDEEVDGPEPVIRGRDTLIPLSRTFIPARLADNPFIDQAQYQKQLDALPEPYRSSVRDGNFMAARQDHEFQVVPTEWIRAAQERWHDHPPAHAPMTALAADVAQGGKDTTTIATRYDAWFAPLKQFPGRDTPTGNEVAGIVVAERRNGCAVGVDMGGGYGGSTVMRLKDNGIEVAGHKGSEASVRRTADNLLGFFNKRAEVYWRLREALDPAQDGGSMLALPDDPELVSDLTAPRFQITSRGIKITPKEEVVEMLGRSPDKGDAVTICWSIGPKLITHGNQWRKFTGDGGRKVPQVIQSRMAARKR